MQISLIAIFGVLGVLSRYGIDQIVKAEPMHFPVSTLTVNMLGSFLVGCLFAYFASKNSHPLHQPLIIGFCGGLTTFSSYSLQILNLMQLGEVNKSLIYAILSPSLGVLLALTGYKIVTHFS